jgi:hypothetical protein
MPAPSIELRRIRPDFEASRKDSHPLRHTTILSFQSLSQAEWVPACNAIQFRVNLRINDPQKQAILTTPFALMATWVHGGTRVAHTVSAVQLCRCSDSRLRIRTPVQLGDTGAPNNFVARIESKAKVIFIGA